MAGALAAGECTLYDERGPIGHSLVCAVANARRPSKNPELKAESAD